MVDKDKDKDKGKGKNKAILGFWRVLNCISVSACLCLCLYPSPALPPSHPLTLSLPIALSLCTACLFFVELVFNPNGNRRNVCSAACYLTQMSRIPLPFLLLLRLSLLHAIFWINSPILLLLLCCVTAAAPAAVTALTAAATAAVSYLTNPILWLLRFVFIFC